jgi:hypothetical protein
VKGLKALPGVASAKEGSDKYHYEVTIREDKGLSPMAVQGMLDEMKRRSGGDEDYPLLGFEVRDLAGTVTRKGEAWTFEARGSKAVYDLKPDEALRKRVESGTASGVLSGLLTQAKGARPVLTVRASK